MARSGHSSREFKGAGSVPHANLSRPMAREIHGVNRGGKLAVFADLGQSWQRLLMP